MSARPRRAPSAASMALGLAVAVGAGCRTATDVQRDYARTLQPAQLPAAPAASSEPVRVLRVRAWVDGDYRTQTLRPEARIREQLERANRLLEPQFGLRLEVESVRPWSRPPGNRDLPKALIELAALDPGTDVDWVVGYVAAFPVFAAEHEQLGLANLFGRHFVLRAMDSWVEAQQLNQVLDKLKVEERESLLRERKLHKETAVLLHEWAHTLGALHEDSQRHLMSPVYAPAQATFSEVTARLVALGLRQRDGADRSAWRKAHRDELERAGYEVPPAARAAGPGFEEGRGAARDGAGLSREDARGLEEALRLAHAGELDRAWGLAKPLAAGHPRDPKISELVCWVAERRGPASDEALGACASASRLAGARPEVRLTLARVRLAQQDRPGGLAELSAAEKELGAGGDEEAWADLAALYRSAGACTAAERAAGRARPEWQEAIASSCARLRRAVGLPRAGAAVPEQREADYVAAVQQGQREVEAGRAGRARAQSGWLAQAFPRAAGAKLVDCAVAALTAPASARSACAAASRAAPEASYPQYVLGVVAIGERRWKEARQHLRRSLELDDELADAWARLALVHQRLGEAGELRALRERHRARFDVDLQVPSS